MMRRLLVVAAIVLLPSSVLAQSCNFNISAAAFGNVDTLSGAPTDTTATLAISCTSVPLTTVRICPSIGAGSGGATASARQMKSGGSTLNYQLYQDVGRTVVWGSFNWGLPGTPPTIDLPIALNGTGSANVTIYGRVFGGQSAATPGTYTSNFSASDDDFIFATLGVLPCPNVIVFPQHAHPTFTASASVLANCNVVAQDINFGTQGILQTNVDAAAQLTVSCTPGTNYDVGLDGGQTNASPSARLMALGAQTITYGLFRDAIRTLVWGNTIGTNTATGTGNGAAQIFSVYGRVPPQTTPSAGTYRDTIVVTITF